MTLSAQVCSACGQRTGTERWGDALAATHGFAQMWCRLCVLNAQIEHAMERVLAIAPCGAGSAASAATECGIDDPTSSKQARMKTYDGRDMGGTSGKEVQREESAIAWELRSAWAVHRRVVLTLSPRCVIDRVEGLVEQVAVTGAFVVLDGWHIPTIDVLAVHRPHHTMREAA